VDLGLKGRTALVTGSHRGTGRGIARRLAQEGARVLVHGLDPGQPEPVVEALRAEGLEVEGVVGDIRNDAGAAEVVDAVGALGVSVEVLVNNYGVAEGGDWTSSTDDWVDIYQKNVLSAVRMIHAFTPAMRGAGWGRVVLLGTIGQIRPNSRMPHYYASKAALPNLCVSLAKELAGTGITVNLVSPGMIATDEVKAMLFRRAEKHGWGDDWETVQREAARQLYDNPCGRIAEIDEVASLVAFLCSDLAGYINAANIRIDGGTVDAAF